MPTATIRDRPSLDLFISAVDENLLCVICTQVLSQPETACIEGHVFCSACLDKAVLSDSTRGLVAKCAVCRGKLRRNRVKAMDNIIKNLTVRCSSNQCAWEGKLEGWDSHMEACPYQTMACPFEACDWQGERRALPAHSAAASAEHATKTSDIIATLRSELAFCVSIAAAPLPSEGVWGPGFGHVRDAEPAEEASDGEGEGGEAAEGEGSGEGGKPLNWVPCALTQVQITSGLWHGREGFVTEILGTQCKVDLTDSGSRGRCTIMFDQACFQPVRPKKNAKVVIFSGELRGKRGTLTGILRSGGCESCVVKTEGDNEIHVLQLTDVAALKGL